MCPASYYIKEGKNESNIRKIINHNTYQSGIATERRIHNGIITFRIITKWITARRTRSLIDHLEIDHATK
jgi:hypothetical protein